MACERVAGCIYSNRDRSRRIRTDVPEAKVRVVKSDLVRTVSGTRGPLQLFHLVVCERGRDRHLTVADIRPDGKRKNCSYRDETARNDGGCD